MAVKVDGVVIGTANVKAILTAPKASQRVRQVFDATTDGGESATDSGLDAIRGVFELELSGATNAVHAEAAFIIALIQARRPHSCTLEVVSGKVYRNLARIAIAYTKISDEVIDGATCIYVLGLEGAANQYIADGGAFVDRNGGSFLLQSTGPSVWIREDGTNTGATPFVDLPEQTAGYPLFLQRSTRTFVTVAPTSTFTTVNRDGKTRTWGRYDASNYLLPSLPAAAESAASYEYKSSPTTTWLDGGV